MYTKTLMSLSALLMALVGLVASFAPRALLTHYGSSPDRHTALVVQVVGATYLGFAMLNWMARHILIGGIYGRPVALGNFLHFVVAALALLKTVMSGSTRTGEIIAAAAIYSILAVWFGVVVFTHPTKTVG